MNEPVFSIFKSEPMSPANLPWTARGKLEFGEMEPFHVSLYLESAIRIYAKIRAQEKGGNEEQIEADVVSKLQKRLT